MKSPQSLGIEPRDAGVSCSGLQHHCATTTRQPTALTILYTGGTECFQVYVVDLLLSNLWPVLATHIWQLCTSYEYCSYLGRHMEVPQTHSQHFMNTTHYWNQKYLQWVWQKGGRGKVSMAARVAWGLRCSAINSHI